MRADICGSLAENFWLKKFFFVGFGPPRLLRLATNFLGAGVTG